MMFQNKDTEKTAMINEMRKNAKEERLKIS